MDHEEPQLRRQAGEKNQLLHVAKAGKPQVAFEVGLIPRQHFLLCSHPRPFSLQVSEGCAAGVFILYFKISSSFLLKGKGRAAWGSGLGAQVASVCVSPQQLS